MGKKLRLRHYVLPTKQFLLIFDNVPDSAMDHEHWRSFGEFAREHIEDCAGVFAVHEELVLGGRADIHESITTVDLDARQKMDLSESINNHIKKGKKRG